jgi:hypothetical protein
MRNATSPRPDASIVVIIPPCCILIPASEVAPPVVPEVLTDEVGPGIIVPPVVIVPFPLVNVPFPEPTKEVETATDGITSVFVT